jgi:N-acetylneuraminic acid mutarotase
MVHLKSFVLLLGVLVAQASMSQEPFYWEQRASLPAAGRWGAFNFEIDGYGYVAGGHDGSLYRSDVWRYNPLTDTWEQRASMPGGRRHGTSWSMNGKGYVTCGQSALTSYSNMLWEYDPTTDSWSVKAPMPGVPRYGTHGFAVGGYGYVGGGNYGADTGPYLNDMWRYDPGSDQWTQVNGIPGLARYGSTSFACGGRGHVHGGRDASLAFTNEHWVFDGALQSWTLTSPMPGPGRSWAMVMAYPFDAVVAGGKDSGVNILQDAYWYYPDINLWAAIPDYPGASGWSGASFSLGERVFGGLGRRMQPTNTYHNDWWELVKSDKNSIEEHSGLQLPSMTVLPNPMIPGSPVSIDWTGAESGQRYGLYLQDIAGRVVQILAVVHGSPITLPAMSSGHYIMTVHRNGDRIAQGRIVVAQD